MKRSLVFILIIYCILISGCILNKKEVSSIKISVEKQYVVPDGIDEVYIFAEMYDQIGNIVDGFSGDYYVNGKKMTDSIFRTTKNGKYEIYSKLGNVISNKIIITADLILKLNSSRYAIDIGDENKSVDLSLEALSNGAAIDTKNVKYFVNEQELNGTIFTPEKTGIYIVKAKYGENESQTTTIEAFAVKSINMTLTKKEILPNNIDTTSISAVKLLDENGNDVKEKYKSEFDKYYASKIAFYNGEQKLDGNSFKTSKTGEYSIYAKYRDVNSNNEKIKAFANIKVVPDRTMIDSDNRTINISIACYNSLNEEVSKDGIKCFINGNEINTDKYTFLETGNHEIKATIGDVTSTTSVRVVEKISSWNLLNDLRECLKEGKPFGKNNWGFGWSATLDGKINLYNGKAAFFQSLYKSEYMDGFCEDNGADYGLIFINDSQDGRFNVPIGWVAIHPGSLIYGITQWKSFGDRKIEIDAKYLAGDVGNVDLYIYKNDILLFKVLSTNKNEQFLTSVNVKYGDLIKFIIGSTDDYRGDSTPISVDIREIK